MKAMVVETCGGPDQLVYREARKPEPKPGEALIKLKVSLGCRGERDASAPNRSKRKKSLESV